MGMADRSAAGGHFGLRGMISLEPWTIPGCGYPDLLASGEVCDGTGPNCPPDTFKSSGTVCRASADTCDATETCTGSSADCPADGVEPAGTTCRPAAGATNPSARNTTGRADGDRDEQSSLSESAGGASRGGSQSGCTARPPEDVMDGSGQRARRAARPSR